MTLVNNDIVNRKKVIVNRKKVIVRRVDRLSMRVSDRLKALKAYSVQISAFAFESERYDLDCKCWRIRTREPQGQKQPHLINRQHADPLEAGGRPRGFGLTAKSPIPRKRGRLPPLFGDRPLKLACKGLV
jgi:hypothetical protein